MEFLRAHKRRTLLSETIYILLNIALAVAVLILVWATGTPWLALLLVFLSKWRVFAVRPRYWFAHVEANTVDLIVSVGFVILIYLVNQADTPSALMVQTVITFLYAGWLLLLKPRSKRNFVVIQAAIALTVGSLSVASLSYEWPSSVVVIAMWIIGYSTARHALASYSETELRLLSLIWGFVIAEIGWLTYHWTIAYTLPFVGGLKLPQVTLIVLGVSFLAERVYDSIHRHKTINMNDIILPMLLTLGIIVILLVVFNAASIGAV
ncbi:MAG: hypothetical protein WAW80_02420 [Candidatus Saccharimonadales bacterium]